MANRKLIAAGVGASMLIGGAAGLAITVPTGAFAQDASATEEAPTGGGPAMRGGGNRMQEMLDAKVADGTITQEQADAMASDAAAHRAEHDGDRGPGGMGGRRGHRGPGGPGGRGGMPLETAAETIGISVEDLRTQLRDGQSLAAIAEANGVDTNALVDALTDKARTRITDMVNRVPGERMGGDNSPAGEGD